jgi:hypothetical protein
MVRSRGESRTSDWIRLYVPDKLLTSLAFLVRSFLSSFGGSSRKASPDRSNRASNPPSRFDTPSPDTPSPHDGSPSKADRRMSRPGSTVFSHNPPFMQLAEDTPAELQRIFSYLNSHTNKLFYEGYFLKLNDLDNSRYYLLHTSFVTDLRRWPAVR